MRNLNTESMLVVESFFEKVKGLKKDENGKYPATDAYKRTILNNAYQLLSSGYSFEYLLGVLNKATPDDIQDYNLTEYIQKKDPGAKPQSTEIKPTIVKDNCMSIGTFYYHPVLQLTSKPPAYILDATTMEMTKEEPEPFYLEMRPHFTLDDLSLYFLRRTEQEESFLDRYKSQLKKLVLQYGLDLTLYLIDAGVNEALDEGTDVPTAPIFFTEYISEARRLYDNRKEIALEGGLTHVYPRKQTD